MLKPHSVRSFRPRISPIPRTIKAALSSKLKWARCFRSSIASSPTMAIKARTPLIRASKTITISPYRVKPVFSIKRVLTRNSRAVVRTGIPHHWCPPGILARFKTANKARTAIRLIHKLAPLKQEKRPKTAPSPTRRRRPGFCRPNPATNA